MKLGIIGLGKMGMNLALNMRDHGLSPIGFDISMDAQAALQEHGVDCATSIQEMITILETPRVIWLMLPAGAVTEAMCEQLLASLAPCDIVIDGGNAHYKDSLRRAQEFLDQGIHFLDCGSSGGVDGARHGGNFMIGGEKAAFNHVEFIFKAISVEGGYLYTGLSGSGHYLKMIHNGIEYGMMQAIGEGFEILEKGPFAYNNSDVAHLWNHGSVIRSWLMELSESAFNKDEKLETVNGIMYSSGEGKWTVQEALELNVAAPVITTSLLMRYRSLEEDTFTGKVVASLRNEFGGHTVSLNKEEK